ncbi:MAG: hypothetical protein D3908_10185, partial [Candidatus Electrothrix sp. AUS4]|nr:hypothetical protein [Candidatus Electrothrix sp. AUS4]
MNQSRETYDAGYEQASEYFDSQLIKLGLTHEQINKQSLEELNESLNTVNEALQNPDSFGEFKISYSANARFYVVQAESNYHRKISILPILLERKKLIVERIKELSTGKKLESLHDLISNISDENLKQKLFEELTALKKEADEYTEETRNITSKEVEERLKLEQEIARQKLELLEHKTRT